MKRNTDFMIREIAGETVLVATGQSAQKFNGLITLNETAAFIMKKLDEAENCEILTEMVMNEFEIDMETAKRDVEGFVKAMMEQGILE